MFCHVQLWMKLYLSWAKDENWSSEVPGHPSVLRYINHH